MEKLLLVDGSNLLFQMFFGMPARIVNHRGKAIQGTLGFVGALLKMVRMVQPTHLGVLFDGQCSNPRYELDETYKANREDFSQAEEEDNPFSQLPDIYAALEYMGIAFAETTDCETDDQMAAYACSRGERELVIASQDSDFFQLIGDGVQILRYRGDRTVFCDREYLRRKLQIAPEQYAAFKALTGDPSDNIKGVPGIGPKTAADLMNRFCTLENLLNNPDKIPRDAVRKAVTEHCRRVQTNYRLIRLEGNVPLPLSFAQLQYHNRNMTTAQVLQGIGLR